jgi:hypothetical protein
MEPQPILTILFVKRFLLAFVGILILQFTFPQYSGILWGVFVVIGVLIVLVFQFGFPKTQITVDEENISFKREFPAWYPLKKYYLHELIIPHTDWDTWVKVFLPRDNLNKIKCHYLFFKAQHLCFVVQTRENGNLEYWVQKKFPDRSLETEYSSSFGKHREMVDQLKEKDWMKVF